MLDLYTGKVLFQDIGHWTIIPVSSDSCGGTRIYFHPELSGIIFIIITLNLLLNINIVYRLVFIFEAFCKTFLFNISLRRLFVNIFNLFKIQGYLNLNLFFNILLDNIFSNLISTTHKSSLTLKIYILVRDLSTLQIILKIPYLLICKSLNYRSVVNLLQSTTSLVLFWIFIILHDISFTNDNHS